jgi:hypothetical protein
MLLKRVVRFNSEKQTHDGHYVPRSSILMQKLIVESADFDSVVREEHFQLEERFMSTLNLKSPLFQ